MNGFNHSLLPVDRARSKYFLNFQHFSAFPSLHLVTYFNSAQVRESVGAGRSSNSNRDQTSGRTCGEERKQSALGLSRPIFCRMSLRSSGFSLFFRQEGRRESREKETGRDLRTLLNLEKQFWEIGVCFRRDRPNSVPLETADRHQHPSNFPSELELYIK